MDFSHSDRIIGAGEDDRAVESIVQVILFSSYMLLRELELTCQYLILVPQQVEFHNISLCSYPFHY